MKGKCWNCGKMNDEITITDVTQGWFRCYCRHVKDSGETGLLYLPLEVVEERRRLAREKAQRTLSH